MSTRRCPRCQVIYQAPARYCARDGAPLVDVAPGAARARPTAPRRTLPDEPPKAPAPPISLTGQTIAGRYRVLRRLGEGGMSHVYLAADLTDDSERAVKVLTPRLASDTGSKERLRREALLARRFDHPNVCSVLDVGETEAGHLFLVMPYLRGESLNDSETRRGQFPVAEGIEMLRQLAEGLQHAHELGVIHRDLKPENVMLVPEATQASGVRAVVMDFGLAKALQAGAELTRLTQTGIVLGTPEFMSPEQVYGRAVDARSDIFGLAILGFEMFTGELPFAGRTSQEMMLARLRGQPKAIRSVRGDLPARMDAVFARALAVAPADRYQDMRSFAAALVESGGGGLLSRLLRR